MSYNKTLNKNDLDLYFSELGKLLKKKIRNKNISVEIIVVGGASILLNYNFRNRAGILGYSIAEMKASQKFLSICN